MPIKVSEVPGGLGRLSLFTLALRIDLTGGEFNELETFQRTIIGFQQPAIELFGQAGRRRQTRLPLDPVRSSLISDLLCSLPLLGHRNAGGLPCESQYRENLR